MSDSIDIVGLLTNLAIQETPVIIDRLKDLFRKSHPDQPDPTSEQVIAAYQSAFASSVAKDEMWLAAHPETP